MAAEDAGRALPAAAAQSLVESFCAVTSATSEEAAFFLESHNWALESAVRSFYDSAGFDADGPDPPPPSTDSDEEDYVGDDDNDDAALAAAAAAADDRRRAAKRQKRSHNARGGCGNGGASGRGIVRTLSDLGGGRTGAGSDGDEEDEEWALPPELHTGSEKSGMIVRDQSKLKSNADEIFKQAKRKGAKQGPFEARQQSSNSRSFSGASRLLTGETVQPDEPQPQENIVHNIYFWSNGFTVDDGQLRSFDDPENASFLESIKNSECPTELEPADGRSKVNVNLVRKEEKCPEPVKRAAPFQGGRTLGTPDNSAPSDITSAVAASSTATATKTMTLTVDESLPSTSLQIRFADGSRVVARFNTSHTIGDVRAFLDATRPGEASDYTLQVGFPPKPLDDVTKTIEEAGVANSVIIQKV